MSRTHPSDVAGRLLLVGASRGLGLAMAGEFAKRGWHVVATARGYRGTALDELSGAFAGRIEPETLDITRPDEIEALARRLSGRSFDMLFVNAGVAGTGEEGVANVTSEEFARVLVTNALGPMSVLERLQNLVMADGLLGVMSSGQGSIANNTNGRHEIYRSSKAALNQLMKSHAARHPENKRALLLLAPGWIRTDLGGPEAPYGVEESVPRLADIMIAKRRRPGLEYLDRDGHSVPW